LHNIRDAPTNRTVTGRVKQLTHDHTRWELADDFQPLLAAVLAAPSRVVKESAAKLVTEHRVGERSFFIKRYRHAAFPFRPLKFVFKPSQAREEWRLAQALADRGIPTVHHVALGERWSATGLQESILITEAFAGVPANEVPDLNGKAITAFINRMAMAGVVQHDLHAANLLVCQHPFEIRLVDLHGIHLVESASRIEREIDRDRMLAVLRASVPMEVSKSVEAISHDLRQRALDERSKRCLRSNREFSTRRFGAWQWQVRTAPVTPGMEKLLANPDEFIERGRALKRGRSSTVAAGNGLVLKRYNFKKPFNLLKDFFRGSRGRRGFRKAYHLELCGIATPRVIATADHRILDLPMRSYVLMEEIPDAVDAGQWRGEQHPGARAVGRLIAQLHNEGFTHRDLKETNILFDPSGRPFLIDLDGLEFVSNVSADDAAMNLRRLAVGVAEAGKLTRANTIAFLLTYSRLRNVSPRKMFPRGNGSGNR